jgi:hypothetical protein
MYDLGGWGDAGQLREGEGAVAHGGEALVIRLPIKWRLPRGAVIYKIKFPASIEVRSRPH